VAPNQLEEKFGGTAKDKEEGDYWPPSLPDNDFGVGEKTKLEDIQKLEVADVLQGGHVLDSEKNGPMPDFPPEDWQ
jgi:hypothetical protein